MLFQKIDMYLLVGFSNHMKGLGQTIKEVDLRKKIRRI